MSVILLPLRCDSSYADALAAQLSQTDDLKLDASKVQMLGGLCVEALLDAVAERGSGIAFTGTSESFIEALAAFGLSLEVLAEGRL